MNWTIVARTSDHRRRPSCPTVAGWVVAWNVVGVLVALAAVGQPVSTGSRGGMPAPRPVDLEIIGSSYTTDEDGGTRLIDSVILGDPRPAERRASAAFHQF